MADVKLIFVGVLSRIMDFWFVGILADLWRRGQIMTDTSDVWLIPADIGL